MSTNSINSAIALLENAKLERKTLLINRLFDFYASPYQRGLTYSELKSNYL